MPQSPRERVRCALNHQQPDRVPLDIGSTPQSGIHASTLSKLRAALGLEQHPLKLWEPYQCLGEVELDLVRKLGIDVVGISPPGTFLGYKNVNWKPWSLPDGTNVMVGRGFVCEEDAHGNKLVYPQGDRLAAPSAKMPKDGAFFDAIIRQESLDESALDPEDYRESFSLFSDEDVMCLKKQAEFYFNETDLAVVGNFGQAGFGDIATVPGVALKRPKGIREPQQWIMAHMTHPDYIMEIFDIQCDFALKNLELYRQAVGDMIDVITISGTDFGSQLGPLLSVEMFREMYRPYYERVNNWVHAHTSWKTWFHCCGSIMPLLDDFIEMGVDILNPVQCSACNMEPATLKKKYGDRLVFWGGGVDTQHTLPFGTPDEVRTQVRERLQVFEQGGGFVFNAIHNIQAGVPVENLLAMFEAFRHFNGHPIDGLVSQFDM